MKMEMYKVLSYKTVMDVLCPNLSILMYNIMLSIMLCLVIQINATWQVMLQELQVNVVSFGFRHSSTLWFSIQILQ